jgi:hypothetical protein
MIEAELMVDEIIRVQQLNAVLGQSLLGKVL